MTHLGLFEGIGGFSLAARWAGWETIAWCEWNEFGQKVLRHHFPEATGHGDITKTDFTIYANKIDVLTGGFPCQPYSTAGKRLGKDDERHLWPEMLRAIREIQPRWVVGENVRGLVNWNGGMVFDEVQADLEACGYEVLPFILPACAKNAPHRRDRVWFVAYSNSNDGRSPNRESGCTKHETNEERQQSIYSRTWATSNEGIAANTNGSRWQQGNQKMEKGSSEQFDCSCIQQDAFNSNCKRCKRSLSTKIIGQFSTKERSSKINLLSDGKWRGKLQFENFPTQPPICSGDDGLPARLDGITFSKWRNESIKAYGNAVVPQVAYEIFKAINEYESI
jgi:DNA (cytosine-5)-methyltransferase 1